MFFRLRRDNVFARTDELSYGQRKAVSTGVKAISCICIVAVKYIAVYVLQVLSRVEGDAEYRSTMPNKLTHHCLVC